MTTTPKEEPKKKSLTKDNLDKLNQALARPALNWKQTIVIVVMVYWLGFIVSELFVSLDSFLKFSISFGFFLLGIFAGIKTLDLDALGERFKGILQDRSLTTWDKISTMLQAFQPYWDKVGKLFEVMYAEQEAERKERKQS